MGQPKHHSCGGGGGCSHCGIGPQVSTPPVDVWVDGQVLEEHLEFCSIVVSGVEEAFERPDAGTLFLEKLDNRFSFPLVGGGGVRR